ncbi:putative receptor-like protein kinase, partial [Ananas comosus]
MLILFLLSVWATSKRKTRRPFDHYGMPQIPVISKEITVDQVGSRSLAQTLHEREAPLFPSHEKYNDQEYGKTLAQLPTSKSIDADTMSQSSSVYDEGSSGRRGTVFSRCNCICSPLNWFAGILASGWGHWFTLRDLSMYKSERARRGRVWGCLPGRLINGTEVAVKKILNNLGQAEKEFRVEVEAIGHVRHKNLVRLLGYCVEGVNRMLVYEYVNNGNLEQWLHGAMRQRGVLTWENRMKVILGTAKALAYLHEAIEPKVVHRDIKSSNILIDEEFNGKVSDFGLAKLLGSDKSHITTRVMGTFGYVAPEYANTGMLNEKSDVYSFGVLLLEAVTGRDPVDYSRPPNEWLKMMVGNRRAEEVVDPALEVKPATRALKRALLVALRCVDHDSEKRPKMGQVVRMLEADEVPHREDRRNRRSNMGSMDMELLKENSNSSDSNNKVGKLDNETSE